MGEVKRYKLRDNMPDTAVLFLPAEVVSAEDYATLEAENAKLRAELERRVPDVSAMARVLSDRAASACCVDSDDNWKVYGQEFIDDVRAMLAAPATVPDAITMADVMRAWEYAEDHPHKYLRGTTNWCAAVAHSLNQRDPSAQATVQGDEAGETRRVCHACATWSRNKACPVCDPQMSNMTLQLLEALEDLVRVNEQHNAAIQRVTGTPAGWKDDYLNHARAAIAAARKGEGG